MSRRLGGERSILLSYRRIVYILFTNRLKVNMCEESLFGKHFCLQFGNPFVSFYAERQELTGLTCLSHRKVSCLRTNTPF